MTLKVLVMGQDFWAARLQQVLTQYGESRLNATCWPVTEVTKGFRKWTSVPGTDVFLRVGMRPGSPSIRGKAFDAFWHTLRMAVPRAKSVYYWIGTDVALTLQAVREGKMPRRAVSDMNRSVHLADADWLTDELRQIGISASTHRLPGILKQPHSAPSLPETVRVLTYIPDSRHRFYGGSEIFNAARELPGVAIDVVGGQGSWIPHPLPNLIFHGWQADLTPFYERSSAVLRLVEHDGMGATAVEGLLFGRQVLYSYPLPHAILVPFGDAAALIAALQALIGRLNNKTLGLNTEGRQWASTAFDVSTEGPQLVEFLVDAGTKAVQ